MRYRFFGKRATFNYKSIKLSSVRKKTASPLSNGGKPLAFILILPSPIIKEGFVFILILPSPIIKGEGGFADKAKTDEGCAIFNQLFNLATPVFTAASATAFATHSCADLS